MGSFMVDGSFTSIMENPLYTPPPPMASALECNTRCHLGSMFLEIHGDNVRSLRTYGVFRPIHTWHIHVFDPHVHMHTHSMSSLPHPRRRWSQNCEKWWQLDKEQGVMNVDTCHLAIHRLPFITTSLVVVQLTGWATSRFFLDLETTHGFACFEGQLKFAESAKNGKLWKWIKSSIDWGRPLTLEHSVASTVQPTGLLQHRSHHCWEPKLFKFTERLLGTSCLEFFQNTTHKVSFLIFPSRQKKTEVESRTCRRLLKRVLWSWSLDSIQENTCTTGCHDRHSSPTLPQDLVVLLPVLLSADHYPVSRVHKNLSILVSCHVRMLEMLAMETDTVRGTFKIEPSFATGLHYPPENWRSTSNPHVQEERLQKGVPVLCLLSERVISRV